MKIAVITGSRAEYGIMRNLISKIQKDNFFELEILVTGMHLEEKYGNTWKYIIDDGFNINGRVYSEMGETTPFGVNNSISKTISGFGEIFEKSKYDAILVLGDRYEILSACISASMYRIPIIHLHGGEITSGNYDEFIRHSITKMAHLHFTSTEIYRKRVIQLGEQPSAVYNVGALGVENVLELEKTSLDSINTKISTQLENKKFFVVAFHPETLTMETNKILLDVLSKYVENYKIVFIGTNSDIGADECTNNVNSFIEKNSMQTTMVNSLSQTEYFSLVSNAKIFIGNSSSGVIEVPSLKVGTVNIGNRQTGRVTSSSTISCSNEHKSIEEAIQKSLNIDVNVENPYELPGTASNIIRIIKSQKLKLIKEFYDMECDYE